MDKKCVDLTIVIISYNNENQILKCLDSIVAETKSTLTQLIVVDNASSDGSVKSSFQSSKRTIQGYIEYGTEKNIFIITMLIFIIPDRVRVK